MAKSAIDKATTLFKALTHSNLDKLTDHFAIPVLQQNLRDLGELELQMVDEAAEARSRASSALLQVTNYEAQVAKLMAGAEQFATDNIPENDADGEAMVMESIRIQDLLTPAKRQAQVEEQLATKYGQVEREIAAKKATLTVKLRTIESQQGAVEAQERGIKTLDSLQGVLDATESGGVDDVLARQQAKAAATSAKFDARLGRVSSSAGVDPTRARAQAMMAELRAKKLGTGVTAK